MNHNVVTNGVVRNIPIYIEKKSFPPPEPGPSLSKSMVEQRQEREISASAPTDVRPNGLSSHGKPKSARSPFSSPEPNSWSRTLNSISDENPYPMRTLSRINKLNVIMESGKSKGNEKDAI